MATLFRNPADQEDGLMSPRTILPELEFRLLLRSHGREVWVVVANFLVPESFVLAAVHVGWVTVVLYTSDKTNSLFCNFLSLYEWKSVTPLKGRALKFQLWLSGLRTQLGSMRMRVPSLASLSGLGIQRCHELWCRWQMWLRSWIAVA